MNIERVGEGQRWGC